MPSSPFVRSIQNYMAVRRYIPRTIKSFCYWIKYYIVFNKKKYPKELDGFAVESFLTYLAVSLRVSAATQAVALNALVFLYKNIFNEPIGDIGQFRDARRQRKLPKVLPQDGLNLISAS